MKWTEVKKELVNVAGKLSEASDEYVASKEGIKYSLNKDKEDMIFIDGYVGLC